MLFVTGDLHGDLMQMCIRDSLFSTLHAQSQSREAVGDEVDPQQMDWLKDRKAQQSCAEDSQYLRQVGGQQKLDGFADVVIDPPPLFHC